MKVFILLSVMLTLAGVNVSNASEKIIITVNQYLHHAALDDSFKGLEEALVKRGILPNKATMLVNNAQGNISNSAQISKYHASLKPSFMVAIATPAVLTNISARTNNSTTIAFIAVTDPVAAKIDNQKNIIGVYDKPPIEELINEVKKFFPNLKKIGVVHNSGEINSIQNIDQLKKILFKNNIQCKVIAITSLSDIKIALQKLVKEVDMIYIPQDNIIVSALDIIVNIARKENIPLISNDSSLVAHGVFISYGPNYFSCGQQLANMIADSIEGKEIQPVQLAKVNEIKINYQVGEQLNIQKLK